MKLLSVNVSKPKEVSHKGKTVSTGIFKEPIEGRVMLRATNLEGDGQADLKVHGGPDRAVYAYTAEHYEYWKGELGRDELPYGQFGENFTVEGMPEDEVHIGDRFRVGTALLEVTQPRLPCYKLGLRMEMETFPKIFLASERSGFYLRVLEEGEVGAGDAIELIEADPGGMTVREIHRLYFDKKNVEGAKRALSVSALSPGWRESFEQIIEKSEESPERE